MSTKVDKGGQGVPMILVQMILHEACSCAACSCKLKSKWKIIACFVRKKDLPYYVIINKYWFSAFQLAAKLILQ